MNCPDGVLVDCPDGVLVDCPDGVDCPVVDCPVVDCSDGVLVEGRSKVLYYYN